MFRRQVFLLIAIISSAATVLGCGQTSESEFNAEIEARAREMVAELDRSETDPSDPQVTTTASSATTSTLPPLTASSRLVATTLTAPAPVIECRDAYIWYQRLNRTLAENLQAFDNAYLEIVNTTFDEDSNDTEDWQPWLQHPATWKRLEEAWHGLMGIPAEFPMNYIFYRDEIECPAEGFGREWYDLRDIAAKAYSDIKWKYVGFCTVLWEKDEARQWSKILPPEWCELEIGLLFLGELEDSNLLYSDLLDRLE